MTFPSRSEYESLVYGLAGAHPEVTGSTLHMYSTSALTSIVQGQVTLTNGLVLRIVEAVDFKRGRILQYSYTVMREEGRVRWYDSQPHPENPDLASTFPHHWHEPPDIKHNRQPAPGISCTAPDFSTLIADCLAIVERRSGEGG